MPKPLKHKKRPNDVNQLTGHLMAISKEQDSYAILPPTKAQISVLMAQLGQRGGKIGGKRRLETMTADQRRNVARKAARARWKNK